ncbi:MAG TPA: hypothetical protein DHV85_01345 [Candidatus Accumulibacter sp.]|nr:hypothetical protein [Accumulibacter sp.]
MKYSASAVACGVTSSAASRSPSWPGRSPCSRRITSSDHADESAAADRSAAADHGQRRSAVESAPAPEPQLP